MKRTITGLAQLRSRSFCDLKGLRLGVLANQASIDCDFSHLLDLLELNLPGSVATIFAPEHGFCGSRQNGEDLPQFSQRGETRIVNLYGLDPQQLKPRRKDFSQLDVLVVDLPDVGARYYTYAQSMIYSLQVAAETGTKVLVLDRPNPINGVAVEGFYLPPALSSFVGYLPVCARHGLTLGELALIAKNGVGREAINCDLEVIPVSNWKRQAYFSETCLPWIAPSPNMPRAETALFYVGTCLFEGCNLSEGRGTALPFEVVGAPFIEPALWAKRVLELNKKYALGLKGAHLRPMQFKPCSDKFAGELCFGLQIHLLDKNAFQPWRWAVSLLCAAAELFSGDFAWLPPTSSQETPFIDKLVGNSQLRALSAGQISLEELLAEAAADEAQYQAFRREFLLI